MPSENHSMSANQTDVQEGSEEMRPSPRGSKRKVLHLINGEDYSGAERVQDLLALRLPDFGYEAAILSASGPGDSLRREPASACR